MKTNELAPSPDQQTSNPQPTNTPISQQQPSDASSSVEEKAQGKKSYKWLIIGLGFFALVTLGIAGIFVYQNYQLKKQAEKPSSGPEVTSIKELQPTPTNIISLPSPTPIADPTADWEIYTNGKYDYSLRYPKNFIVEELPQQICPSVISGCRTVKEKGDQVKIYNEKSSFIIKIDNEMQYPSIGSTCTEKIGEISTIIIDGDILYEEKSFNTGGFIRIISKHEERKLGEKEVFCPEIIWLHNNYKITISTYITGVSPDDNITVRQILESITFNPKAAI